jgi:hypothetical protein
VSAGFVGNPLGKPLLCKLCHMIPTFIVYIIIIEGLNDTPDKCYVCMGGWEDERMGG